MTDDDYIRLANAIRKKDGNCTAAESFIPGLVRELVALRAANPATPLPSAGG